MQWAAYDAKDYLPKKPEGKSLFWPILALVFCILFLAAGAFAVTQYQEKKKSVARMTSMMQRSYDDVNGNLDNIATSLAKIRVSTSKEQRALLLQDIYRRTGTIQEMLSQMPMNQQIGETLLSFVCQMGDYCYMLSKSVGQSGELTQEDYAQLSQLETQCREISSQMAQERDLGINWDFERAGMFSINADAAGDGAQATGLEKISSGMEQYPKLIYDGPFSEGAQDIQPKGLTGQEVSQEQAVGLANEYFAGSFEANGEMGGNIAGWCLLGQDADGEAFSATVTKTGGHMLSFQLQTPAASQQEKPADERMQALAGVAQDYLAQKGFANMKATYSKYYDGVAVVNLACTQDGVILYPDLIKVWVRIEDEKVVGMDARNYYTCHTARQLPQATYDIKAAEQAVGTRLEITSQNLALIPTDDLKEKLCYEFTGTNNEDVFIVYIDAQTGQEEDILEVIDSENGTFVY